MCKINKTYLTIGLNMAPRPRFWISNQLCAWLSRKLYASGVRGVTISLLLVSRFPTFDTPFCFYCSPLHARGHVCFYTDVKVHLIYTVYFTLSLCACVCGNKSVGSSQQVLNGFIVTIYSNTPNFDMANTSEQNARAEYTIGMVSARYGCSNPINLFMDCIWIHMNI